MIKTPQFEHQQQVFDAHKDDEFYALFWEMGLGKTKLLLDVAAHLHEQGKIKALVIIAPNSVYRNWIGEEAPKHLGTPYIAMPYPKTRSERDRLRKLIFLSDDFKSDHLRVLSISYDSATTTHGAEFVRNVMLLNDTMLVADESTAIKSPSAVRTKAIRKLADMAKYRWIATGTPVAQSPFDIHSQIAFLNNEYWAQFGLKTLTAFKNEFGQFTMRKISGGRQFPELVAYRRLDVLQKIIAPISSRLLKEDSTVKLPPKTYAIRKFELTPGQRKLYNQIKYDYEAELAGGLYLEAPQAIVRLARLQQITSGFVTVEERKEVDSEYCPQCGEQCQLDLGGELVLCADCVMEQNLSPDVNIIRAERKVVDIVAPEDNPRLQLLKDIVDEANHKVIVWCRFTRDVDLICNTLGNTAVRYDGKVNHRDREVVLNRFRDPSDHAQVLVANVHAISQGVTLTIAKTVVYYSNSFSLEKRLQSEDRNHRIGQDVGVLVIDLAAENSVDEKIINDLRNKFNIAASVTGDRFREWIRDNTNEDE